ncbi:CpaF family protein [Virgibacillus sp. W0430]|uniref:CpaF family protein n=1 Tax=Virgibacillus sp. W0430 TaxID=3391580 RepID=UPI003F46D537
MSLLSRLGKEEQGTKPIVEQIESKPPDSLMNKEEELEDLERQLHAYLVDELKKPANQGQDIEPLINNLCNVFFEKEGSHLSYEEKEQLLKDTSHELTGYGPISPLLADSQISEVMVNGPKDIFVEISGKIEKTNVQFRDNLHVLRIIEKIVAPLGRRIDESVPMVDARLPDGSRVNAIIPPLALNGPTLTIRKFAKDPFTIHDLVRFGTLNENMAAFLKASVVSRLNVFISGGTGSGKTSTLNVMSSFIPSDERIVTIEDAAELQLTQEHVVSLESRPPNIEGEGQITIRDLIVNSLRMRPDRIIVGEVRGAEALDMLQAMNTGHEGSLGTGHANSPRDLLARLETMVLMAGFDLPVRAIREQIASALDLIVQQERMRDGTRKVTRITEVLGLEGDTIVLQDVFIYQPSPNNSSENSNFVTTGVQPHCIEQFKNAGFHIEDMFGGEW